MITNTQNNLHSSILRNCFIQFVWWILFNPGFFSTDSFAVLQMVRVQELNALWSSPWSTTVSFLTFQGKFPGIATLFFSQIFALSVTILVHEIVNREYAPFISTVLQITPLVGAMGITLWHDIPMTSGLMLVSVFFTKSIKYPTFRYIDALKFFFPGMLLVTFRGNGLPTVILFIIIFLCCDPKRNMHILFVGVLVAILFTSLCNLRMSERESSNFKLATGFMVYDISCFASYPEGKGFIERVAPGFGDTNNWSSRSACKWFSDSKLRQEQVSLRMNEVPRIWWKLVQEEPLFILKTHVERHQYLVPIPVYGVPKPPFIHSTIEFEDSGISWLFPKIANEARLYIRIWNYFKGFFAYAGLWLLVLGIFTIMTKKREVYYVFLISLILCGSLFIIAGIPDARYTLFVLVAGQAIALNIVFNAFARLRTRSVFKRRHFSHE